MIKLIGRLKEIYFKGSSIQMKCHQLKLKLSYPRVVSRMAGRRVQQTAFRRRSISWRLSGATQLFQVRIEWAVSDIFRMKLVLLEQRCILTQHRMGLKNWGGFLGHQNCCLSLFSFNFILLESRRRDEKKWFSPDSA